MLFGVVQVRPERCLSCKRCLLSCAVAHSQSKDLVSAMKELPRPHSRVSLHVTGAMTVPLQCRQCDAAACVITCPSGAMRKPEPHGPVILDQSLCVGCGNCVLACPYGVPRYMDGGRRVIRCDLCRDRLEQDLLPACVEACPTGTLTFKPKEENEPGTQAAAALIMWKRIEALRAG